MAEVSRFRLPITNRPLYIHAYMHTVHTYIPPSIRPFVRPSAIHPSIHPSIHLSIYPSVHLSIRPSIHPSIHLCACHYLWLCRLRATPRQSAKKYSETIQRHTHIQVQVDRQIDVRGNKLSGQKPITSSHANNASTVHGNDTLDQVDRRRRRMEAAVAATAVSATWINSLHYLLGNKTDRCEICQVLRWPPPSPARF